MKYKTSLRIRDTGEGEAEANDDMIVIGLGKKIQDSTSPQWRLERDHIHTCTCIPHLFGGL